MPKKPIRVSHLNAYIARLLAADGVLSDACVAGEISNYKLHGSGHVFFSLKDEASRLECFLPSGIYQGLDFDISDGTDVVAEGSVNVYEKGGRYSLTIRRLTASGQGDLAQAFEKLKQKLSEKGYFDEKRKKRLPFSPDSIAIVTSDTGAALSDMLKIIQTRNSVVNILIFPTLVQGDGAAGMIASRIRQINEEYPDTDVMIVGRGGGSAEDLAAFNEEEVADAIFSSNVPVISAVGHETDFSIADFVADVRAETPTAAAALAVPDTFELKDDTEMLFGQIKNSLTSIISHNELQIRANNMNALLSRLKSGIAERMAHADILRSGIKESIHEKAGKETAVTSLAASIKNAINVKIDRASFMVKMNSEKLEALGPMSVLLRGYAMVEDEKGKIVCGAKALSSGQRVKARFFDGCAAADIKEVELYGK